MLMYYMDLYAFLEDPEEIWKRIMCKDSSKKNYNTSLVFTDIQSTY